MTKRKSIATMTMPPSEKEAKLNAYVCNNLHATVTAYKDQGTSPMFIMCDQCNERAVSRMGMIDPSFEPTHEWYKPTDSDWKTLSLEIPNPDTIAAFKEHVSKGGVLLRRIATHNYSITKQ